MGTSINKQGIAFASGVVNPSKLEKGEIATAWIPNELDVMAINTMGFAETNISQASIAKECISAPQFYEL